MEDFEQALIVVNDVVVVCLHATTVSGLWMGPEEHRAIDGSVT